MSESSVRVLLVDDDDLMRAGLRAVLGTGIGVAITGVVLLGIGGLFGADWERREIDKYLRRRGLRERPGHSGGPRRSGRG